MINIFKKKNNEIIDKSKTVKLCDLVDNFNMYKEIYNSTIGEVARLIVDNIPKTYDLDDYTLKINFNKEIYFTAESYYIGNSDIGKETINNLINLYGSDKLKKGLCFLNELGYHYYDELFYDMDILYENKFKTKLSYENQKVCDVKAKLTYPKIGDLEDTLNIINKFKDKNVDIFLYDATSYNKLINALYNYKKSDEYKNIFSKNNTLLDIYKDKEIEDEILQNMNFDNKNVSGINISKNKNIHINFDKIVKDLTDSNISGYDLSNYTFKNFNLTNCDMTNTGATIDLSNCTITMKSKISTGTLFDEDNKFIFGNTPLSETQVESLGIKIYKKEK